MTKYYISLASVLGLLSGSMGHGDEKVCASANVVEGNTCSNVKVKFSLADCAGEEPDRVVDKVSCEGQVISARIVSKSVRYEARFEKVDGGWGGIEWVPVGGVKILPPKKSDRNPAANQDTAPIAAPKSVELPAPTPESPAPVVALTPAPSSSEIQVTGYVDFMYQVHLNGQTQVGGRVFDPLANVGSVQWAEVAFDKKSGPIKTHVELAFGEAVERFTGVGTPGRGDSLNAIPTNYGSLYDPMNHVPAAYITYNPESSKRLTLTAGKFYTHVGFEYTKAKDNWNYSRAMAFNYGGPFFHTGVGVGYAVLPDQLNSTLYVLNGWDGRTSQETNQSSTFGLNLGWVGTPGLAANYNVISGSENADKEAVRQVHEVNVSYALSESFSLAVDFLVGSQKHAVTGVNGFEDSQWSSWVGYGKYKFNPDLSLALRYESYNDRDGATLPGTAGFYSKDATKAQTVNAITSTLGVNLAPGTELRVEHRVDQTDKSSTGIFKDRDGLSTERQQTVTLSILSSF